MFISGHKNSALSYKRPRTSLALSQSGSHRPLLHLGSKRRYMSPTHTQSHERSHKKSCCKSKRRVSLAAALSAHTRSRSASTRSNSVRDLLSHCQQQHRPSPTHSSAASLFGRAARRVGRDGDPTGPAPRLRRVLRQLSRDRHEELVDVCGRLRARLHKKNAIVRRVRLGLLRLHLTLRVQVRFVACQGDDDVGVALPLQLLHPLLRALECVLCETRERIERASER